MIENLKKSRLAEFLKLFNGLQKKLVSALLRRRIIGVAVIFSLLSAVYWMLLASDRYVSEAHIIIQRTDLGGSQSQDFSSLLVGAGGSRTDQLLLRDHLLSVDMLKKLDASLDLRAHYSNSERDLLSRMWSKNIEMERFYLHYLSRVSVEFDDYAGALTVKAQAYDEQTAYAINSQLVQEGERFMNQMAHSLVQDQVTFLEGQVSLSNERAMQARRAVLSYQNKKGLVSPQATAENIAAMVAKLESQRTEQQTLRSTMQAYLAPRHPNIVQINQQIEAINKQIILEQARLTSTKGETLNFAVEEFQRLQMEVSFVQDVYKTALVALEKGRIEATRSIKKVSVIQSPTQPESPLAPRRYYNTLVFTLVALMLAGVAHLLAAIVRDHKD